MTTSWKILIYASFCAVVAFGVDITAFKKADGSWDDALAEARKAGRQVVLPGGRYELTRTLDVPDGMALVFEDGAELVSKASPVIRHTGGTLLLEGRGLPGVIQGPEKGERGWSKAPELRAAAIDINTPGKEHAPSLLMRNMEIRGFNGVDGYRKTLDADGKALPKNDIATLEISNCRFLCTEKAIGVSECVVRRARVEGCYLEGCDYGIYLNVPMPGGVSILNNELHDFGRSGIQLGKAGQIADGCTTHLPNAVVQGNRLLKGGRGATIRDSYIQGILVYGNSVTVEGNVIRDVNRGEPVPGEPCGHQIRLEDGTVQRGHWIERNGQRVRLAGAAIYLKANRSVVMGNVCNNSGYRSVIEIKTGGKEPFVSVCNNIVDGRALDIDESFGFECNSGRSLWSNNVVFDMPNQAFVVRSGFENTFVNNLIVNAKVGFGLSGNVPGQGEWLAGNRFINVDVPISIDNKAKTTANIPEAQLPGAVYLNEKDELPEPSSEWRGRMLVKGKDIYVGVLDGEAPKWMAFSGKLLEPKTYHAVGPELAFNWDQSGKDKSPDAKLNDPAYPGWEAWMQTATEKPLDPHDGSISFDTETFRTGGRALKVLFTKQGSAWQLKQPIALEAGRRYRATALVKGEEPRNLRLRVLCGGRNWEQRASASLDWQLLSVDFTAGTSSAWLMVSGSKTCVNKPAWLDSVSVRELMEDGIPAPEDKREDGPELLRPPTLLPNGRLAPGWSLSCKPDQCSIATDENGLSLTAKDKGNIMLSTPLTLQPGEYRLSILLETSTPGKIQASVKQADGTRASGRAPRNQTAPYTCDFTVQKANKVSVGIWAGNLDAGDAFLFRQFSLKKLVAPCKDNKVP